MGRFDIVQVQNFVVKLALFTNEKWLPPKEISQERGKDTKMQENETKMHLKVKFENS